LNSPIGDRRDFGQIARSTRGLATFSRKSRRSPERTAERGARRWLSLQVVLPYPDQDPRVDRRKQIAADRLVHVVKLATRADVDAQVYRWLADAYEAAG